MMNKVLGKEMREGIAPDKGEWKILNSYHQNSSNFQLKRERR